MYRRPRSHVFLIACVLFVASGCNTPDTVSKFCTTSNTALASAAPVFQDLKASCLRARNLLGTDIGTFTIIAQNPKCDELGKQGAAAVDVTKILAAYFSAINSIATFDTAKSASNIQELAMQTGAALDAGSTSQKAIGDIVQFLSAPVLNGYRQHALEEDLPVVSDNIGAVIDRLVAIIQQNYIGQVLADEEHQLTDYYKRFQNAHTPKEGDAGAVTLEIDERWRAAKQAIAAKRTSAQGLVDALKEIKAGVTNLANNAHSLKGKEVPGLLEPYLTQLQAIIPVIQKGF